MHNKFCLLYWTRLQIIWKPNWKIFYTSDWWKIRCKIDIDINQKGFKIPLIQARLVLGIQAFQFIFRNLIQLLASFLLRRKIKLFVQSYEPNEISSARKNLKWFSEWNLNISRTVRLNLGVIKRTGMLRDNGFRILWVTPLDGYSLEGFSLEGFSSLSATPQIKFWFLIYPYKKWP